jgi:hypothetical protein
MKKTIKVAILAEEPIGWGSCKHFFPVILNNYEWKVEDSTYRFATQYIFDKDILKGGLKAYDVLLVPGGGVGDGEAIVKGFNIFPRVRRWKKQICDFIKDGGGYVGICGGAALLTDLKTDTFPRTFVERQYNKSSLGISCVTSYYKSLAMPLFYPLQRRYPEKIGAMSYVFSFAPGETVDGTYIHTGGVPIDFQICKDNPIFRDFPYKKERVRWWGGPALIVPEKPDRKVKVLARYPKKELSEDKSTRIYAWKYTGGIGGFIFAFLKALKLIKKEKDSLKNFPIYTYYLAGPWEPTDKLIELNYSNKPCMTAEIYPNENEGRILLCAAHPEYMVWWGGHIEEVYDKAFNCLATGLHRWKNIEPLSDELTHTWWMVRRFTAWAGKVPEEHLPPIRRERSKELSENIFWDGTLLNQMKNI